MIRDVIQLARNTGDTYLIRWLFFLCAGLAAGLLVSAVLLFGRGAGKRLHLAFAATVFSFGALYSLVLVPLSAPDEVAHYISAYKLSSMLLGQPWQDEEHRILIRTQDVFIDDLPNDGDPDNATVTGARLELSTYRELHARGLGSTGETGTVYSQQIPVSTTPLAYLPQALGFAAARILNLGGFGLLYLGRLGNLLFFTLAATYAVKRIPVGKEILFGTALFPMSLELIGSLSYDVYILALAFVLTAVCTDLCLNGGTAGRWSGRRRSEIAGKAVQYRETVRTGRRNALRESADRETAARSIGWRDILLILLLAALLAPCKMVYAVLFGLCLLISPKRFKSRGQYVLAVALTALVMAAAVLAVNAEQLLRYTGAAAASNGLEWAGGAESYSLAECLADPPLLCSLLFTTLRLKGAEFLSGMAGHWLGNLDPALEVPYPAVCALWGLLLLIALRAQRTDISETGSVPRRQSALSALHAQKTDRTETGSAFQRQSTLSAQEIDISVPDSALHGKSALVAQQVQSFRAGFSAGQRLWLVFLFFLLVSAVCVSMLAAYTPKGETYIRGIQGRYFLPGLPMLMLALSGLWPAAKGKLSRFQLAVKYRAGGKDLAEGGGAEDRFPVGHLTHLRHGKDAAEKERAGMAAKCRKFLCSLRQQSINALLLFLMLLTDAWILLRLYRIVCFRF